MCNLSDNLVEDAMEVGMEVGMKAGKEEGLSEERSRIINKMQEKGISLEQIAELLELPFEEVENLAKPLLLG